MERERDRSLKMMDQLVSEARSQIAQEASREQEISSRLGTSGIPSHMASYKNLNPDQVYSLSDLRAVCTRFRLRFLPSSYYRGNIPQPALHKIRRLEDLHPDFANAKYFIAGPDKAFRLGDANADPLLFAALGNEKYLLIHRWGKDLAWYRRLLSLPMRSILHMLGFLTLLSFAFCMLFPYKVLNLGGESSFYIRGYLFFHSYIAFCGITAFVCFSYNHHFSGMVWNSPYHNE
ncbi:MAG: hypothetical protein KDD36_02870 [Flavobacteriales bacterium]|nr:hypothetical protein [Flavobacteriales bacterium]